MKCENCGLEYENEEELQFLIREYAEAPDERLTSDGVGLKRKVIEHLMEINVKILRANMSDEEWFEFRKSIRRILGGISIIREIGSTDDLQNPIR